MRPGLSNGRSALACHAFLASAHSGGQQSGFIGCTKALLNAKFYMEACEGKMVLHQVIAACAATGEYVLLRFPSQV